jgi:hypothetical protein
MIGMTVPLWCRPWQPWQRKIKRLDASKAPVAKVGLIWVQGLGEESVMAFTDFGVDSLVELMKIHREARPRKER